MFHCVHLPLASQKERRQWWIIFHVQNIIFSEFIFFSYHSSCWMQDAKSGQNVLGFEGIFWLESITRVCFHPSSLPCSSLSSLLASPRDGNCFHREKRREEESLPLSPLSLSSPPFLLVHPVPSLLLSCACDVSFSCVVKTQRRLSNKIYKTELTKTRYNNQVLGKYRVDQQRAGLTLIVELT